MDVELILATPEDGERVYKFLCEQYYLDEPLGAAAGRIVPIDKEHCGPVEYLDYGISVLAVKKDDPVSTMYVVLCKKSYIIIVVYFLYLWT